MTYLSLFSGIGGFDLGFDRAGMRCVGQVEIDPYCQKVLAKHWPNVPRWDDIKTFTGEGFEKPDVICGGFPCQDISNSGSKVGIQGKKSGLWSEFFRIICHLRPRYAVVENVSDIVHRGIDKVLGDLASIGANVEWEMLPAFTVGSPQRRKRIFFIANFSSCGFEGVEERHLQRTYPEAWDYDDGLDLAAHRARDALSWVRRADYGVPNRVDRLRGLGNAVVPQIAQFIGEQLMKAQS